MLTSWSSLQKSNIFIEIFGNRGWDYFWRTRFLPRWLPVLLGLSGGLVLAYLISNGTWYFGLPLVLAVPGAIIFNRYPFIGVIIWSLLMPFFVVTPSLIHAYANMAIHRAVIPLALGIIILSDWLRIKERKPVRLGWPELATVLFMGLVVVNIILTTNTFRKTIINFYELIFIPICMYWIIRLAAPTQKDLERFLWVAFIIVVFESGLGMLSWFSPSSVPDLWRSRVEGERTVGSLKNVAVYTSTLLFFSILLLQYGMHTKSGRLRLVLLLTFGVALFSVFISFSRASWLGETLVLIALLFLYPKTMSRFIIIFATIFFIMASTILAKEIAFATERLTSEKSQQSAESRIITNNASIEMFKAKPWLGWGFRQYDRYDRQFQRRVGDIAVHGDGTSHNTYLTILAELGIIAFGLYMFPVGWWLFLTLKRWRRLPQEGFWSRSLLVSLWIVILHMLIVTSAMDMIRFHYFGTTLWWMVLAFIGNLVDSSVPDSEVLKQPKASTHQLAHYSL